MYNTTCVPRILNFSRFRLVEFQRAPAQRPAVEGAPGGRTVSIPKSKIEYGIDPVLEPKTSRARVVREEERFPATLP